MGQLLLLLVARSAAKPWDQAIKAAVDEVAAAADTSSFGLAETHERFLPPVAISLGPLPPRAPPVADASSARAAIVAAAQSAMQEVEDAPWNVGEQRDCKGDKCWEKSDMSSDQRSTSLSAEVAALVHAAKVNQAIENVQEASKEGLDQTQAQNKREAPKEASSSEFDQSALRSSHREVEGLPEGLQRWQIYLRQAAQRLRSLEMMEVTKASKAVASAASNESHESQAAASSEFERPRAVDPVEEYHMLYEAVNQVIAGLQLAVASAATPEVFAEVASLLVTLAEQSRGTAFEHEDFWSQALAAVALGCRMSRGFGEPQDQDWMCDVVQQQNWLETHENRSGKGTLGGGKRQLHKVWNSVRNATAFLRSSELRSHMQTWRRYWEQGATAPKALWRSTVGSPHRDSFNPSDDLENSNTASDGLPKKKMWQVFPTFIMAKEIELSQPSGRSQPGSGCEPCRHLTSIVLKKYRTFKAGFGQLQDVEINNAFFNWQLTHGVEQEQGQELWPELYGDPTFRELKWRVMLNCKEYLQEVYAETSVSADLEDLELSIWASVTAPLTAGETMGLAFHDHPLALLSGVFYADAGGDGAKSTSKSTPTVFADPRGTTPFRYASGVGGRLEPTAPFHRLAYFDAKTGLSLIFPSWLVHGVAPHHGVRHRVVFAYNLHTSPG
ncbi:Uncharacterized protein SCF082_LOCUS5573, partial [Durusdinium trenchii]